MAPDVRFLSRDRIDAERWDRAVLADPVPLPYGLSWWLDASTEGRWDGLVVDDYRVVLPLPRLRRYRLLPVYIRPPFTQQIGPFGSLRDGDLRAMLGRVPTRFQVSLPLRPWIDRDEVPSDFSVRKRVNFVLDLSPPFETVRRGFQKRMRQYLNQDTDMEDHVVSREEVIELCRTQLGDKGGIRGFHWQRLSAIIDACQARSLGECRGMSENGTLLCVGFYPHLAGRAFNLAAASTQAGFERRAMIHLLARKMQQMSGEPGAAFDFEGSELPGVREFFSRFGGKDEGYFVVEKQWFGLKR